MGITKSSHLIALGAFDASSGSGGSASAVTLLSITTEPSAPFAKGSKYFRHEDGVDPELNNKIYTAVEDDTWDNAKLSDPVWGAYYLYDGHAYVWDGNSLELFELEDYQEKLVSGQNIKTINGISVLGSGNIAIETHQGFNPNWTTDGTFAEFLADIFADTTATPGFSYLGTLRCSSGLPANFSNVEAVVEIQQGPSSKTIHTVITSGNVSPYRWEYTSWNNGSSNSGWISFQLPLTAGTGIDITNDVISVTDTLPSQTGNSGKSLITNGTAVSWQNVEQIKEQNDNELIKFWYGTQNEYDALESYDTNTNYIIVDNSQTISTLLATQAQFNNSAQDKAATPYQVNQVLNNYTLASLSETITSTSPSLTLADNTFYNCTNALTSLTITSIPASNMYGIEIHFTTDAGFSGVTFPAGTLYTGTLPTWEANKSYLISISRNIVVAAEIKAME